MANSEKPMTPRVHWFECDQFDPGGATLCGIPFEAGKDPTFRGMMDCEVGPFGDRSRVSCDSCLAVLKDKEASDDAKD
jgi:hypothetical protein